MFTTNLFYHGINSVTAGKFKTYLCRIGSHSKVVHMKVQKLLVGVRIYGTVRLQWTEKIFESEANVPHVVHRWQSKMLQYQLVIWNQPASMIRECYIIS